MEHFRGYLKKKNLKLSSFQAFAPTSQLREIDSLVTYKNSTAVAIVPLDRLLINPEYYIRTKTSDNKTKKYSIDKMNIIILLLGIDKRYES